MNGAKSLMLDIEIELIVFFFPGWLYCSLLRIFAVTNHVEKFIHSGKYLCRWLNSTGLKQVKISSTPFAHFPVFTLSLYLHWDQDYSFTIC